MGEAGVDAMYKIFLLDQGMSAPEIGWLCGGWGLAFSLAGSLLGGWIGFARDRMASLAWVGAFRAVPLVAIAVLARMDDPLRSGWVVPITLAEHVAGGMITPILFAFMMDLCDRTVGATQFSALAAVELAGKMSVGAVSGLAADRIGYAGLFAAGAVISLLWPLLVVRARKRIVL
jgi:PAT family beta-lactamase induction signal transducer AmpG